MCRVFKWLFWHQYLHFHLYFSIPDENPYRKEYSTIRTPLKKTINRFKKGQDVRDRPYVCTQCPKTFLRKQHLNEHVEVIHIRKEYNCTLCHRVFYMERKMKKHMFYKHQIDASKFSSPESSPNPRSLLAITNNLTES